MIKLTFVYHLVLFIPLLLFSLWVSREKVLKDEPIYLQYAIGLLLILVIWGEVGVYLRQWFYPNNVNLGIYIGSHPIELFAEGIIMPLFIISLWEFIKKFK